MGPDLMGEMRAQAEHFGAEIIRGHVTSVDLMARPYTIKTSDAEYRCRTLIIATGATARLLGLPSERALIGHGVSTCATCDGYFFRGKPIAVVGGGDSAMEEAIFLTRFASHVTVVHRRDTLRASKIMQDKAFANDKISFEWNTDVEEIKDTGKGEVTSMVLRNNRTGERKEIAVDGVFVAIGHTPEHVARSRGRSTPTPNGYILTHCRHAHQRARRLRLRRRPGSRLPPGDHRRRLRLHGGDRRREIPRRSSPASRRSARNGLGLAHRPSPIAHRTPTYSIHPPPITSLPRRRTRRPGRA